MKGNKISFVSFDETKRNEIWLFFMFCKTSKISQFFGFALFCVLRNKKKECEMQTLRPDF
jgi:hypothetical protein